MAASLISSVLLFISSIKKESSPNKSRGPQSTYHHHLPTAHTPLFNKTQQAHSRNRISLTSVTSWPGAHSILSDSGISGHSGTNEAPAEKLKDDIENVQCTHSPREEAVLDFQSILQSVVASNWDLHLHRMFNTSPRVQHVYFLFCWEFFLRYNSPTIKFTCLKYAIQWLIVQSFPTMTI